MKKLWILAAILMLAFAACGGSKDNNGDNTGQTDSSDTNNDTGNNTGGNNGDNSGGNSETPGERPAMTPRDPAPTHFTAPAPNGTEKVIYSLANDTNFQEELEVGETGRGSAILGVTPYLMDAGTPNVTVIQAPGGHNGFRVHDRGDTWGFMVDFMTQESDDFNPPWEMDVYENAYRIVVKGKSEPNINMVLAARATPSNWLYLAATDADGMFEFNVDVSDEIFENMLDEDSQGRTVSQFDTGFRVMPAQSDDENPGPPYFDYEIHEFIVTRMN